MKTVEKVSADESIPMSEKVSSEEKLDMGTVEKIESMDTPLVEGEPLKEQEEEVEEAQFETFVIEPKAVQKRGRKKRCKKPESYSELDEDLQDTFISSSNIIEQNQE